MTLTIERLKQAIIHADEGLQDYEGVDLVWAMEGIYNRHDPEYKESIEIIRQITGRKD